MANLGLRLITMLYRIPPVFGE